MALKCKTYFNAYKNTIIFGLHNEQKKKKHLLFRLLYIYSATRESFKVCKAL